MAAPADADGFVASVLRMLDNIQANLLEKARRERDTNLAVADRCPPARRARGWFLWLTPPPPSWCSWEEFSTQLNLGKMVLAPWCQRTDCEEGVKERTGPKAVAGAEESKADEAAPKLTGAAKSLCIPFAQAALDEGTRCFACGQHASVRCLWGRSY